MTGSRRTAILIVTRVVMLGAVFAVLAQHENAWQGMLSAAAALFGLRVHTPCSGD